MSGGGDKVRVRHRVGMDAPGHESGNVRHVNKQIGADLAGQSSHAFKIDDARVGRGPHRDERGFERPRGGFQLVVVDPLIIRTHPVMRHRVEASGKVRLVTMGEMAAVGQIHG